MAWQDGKYTGSLSLKQTDYVITPVNIAGGAVQLKDEITIDSASCRHQAQFGRGVWRAELKFQTTSSNDASTGLVVGR